MKILTLTKAFVQMTLQFLMTFYFASSLVFLVLMSFYFASSLAPLILAIPMFRTGIEFLWHKNIFFEEYLTSAMFMLGIMIGVSKIIFSMTLSTANPSLCIIPIIKILTYLSCAYFGYHTLKDSKFYTHSRNDKITLFTTIMINALLVTQKILFQNTSIILRGIALIASCYQFLPLYFYFISDSWDVLSKKAAKNITRHLRRFDPIKDVNPLKEHLDEYLKELHYKKHNPAITSSEIKTLPTPGVFRINDADRRVVIKKTMDSQDSAPRFEISRYTGGLIPAFTEGPLTLAHALSSDQ
jgi:hypothetical protein